MLVKAGSVAAIGLMMGLSYHAFQEPAAPAAAPGLGIYTAEQAKRGNTLYKEQQCILCHGQDLAGVGQAPPLATDDFLNKWDGQPVGDFFEKLQKTMPATNPGSLTREQTADLVAYILSANKFPEGKSDLPTDADALKKITFAKPKKQ